MGEYHIEDNELRELLLEKARGVFKICDSDQKGLICKQDLQKLQSFLPLNSQQLDDVFDRLDVDGDGLLTQQKFITGFANFLGLDQIVSDNEWDSYNDDGVFQEDYVMENHIDDVEMNNHFDDLMGKMGARGLLEDENVIKSLWIRLHNSEPDVVRNFEEFLTRITDVLKRTHMDYKELQVSMQNKKTAHDVELQLLYSEMEEQIENEKERILSEEKAKEKKLRDLLEKQLQEKDKLLNDLLRQHNEMEIKLTETKEYKTRRSVEYTRLRRERDEMGQKLDMSNQDLEMIKNKMAFIQSQKRNSRGHINDQVAEWITRERESLLEQLQILKETNRKLLDKQDESVGRKASVVAIQANENTKAALYSFGFDRKLGLIPQASISDSSIYDSSDDYNTDEDESIRSNMAPQRIFKVVFVGDSSVGKSTFIQRVSKKSIDKIITSTIGVDFQVRNLKLDNQMIALQLWDTAGQERFRSFTKQYFRKADGVVVMYDVTCETSFKHIRQWMADIEDSVQEGTVIVIVGNKKDLTRHNSSLIAVTSDVGSALACDYGASFFEASAKDGENVEDCVHYIAKLLRDKEDSSMADSLQISVTSQTSQFKRPSCCKL